jgi:hypothetical protein
MDIINAGTVSSTADLSGTWTSLYDQDYLYFFVDVNDDELSANRPNWYENDGVEIYVDAINRKGSTYQATDFQFNYMIGDNQLRERSRSASTAGCELVRINKTGGYQIEVKIPWSVLGITAPTQSYKIGLDVMLIDNDGGNWQGKKAWFNTADNSWNNPSTFGVANFGGTLPLKLLKFEGKPVKQEAHLTWATADEDNFRGFELYRSTNGLRYTAVSGLIAGGQSIYSYSDPMPPGYKTFFYKLRMIDLDGTARWSPVVKLSLQNGAPVFNVMPNPTSNSAWVLWPGAENVNSIRILDVTGKTLSEHSIQSSNGNSYQINLSSFSKGMYCIVFMDNAGKSIHVEKLIKN